MREALGAGARSGRPVRSQPARRLRHLDADGHVVGRGHTQEAGGPHAEVMALRDAAARGAGVRGATVYVRLEPCAHHGRTPPCADALVAAGVGRVVIAMRDPNPLVAGRAPPDSPPPASRSSLGPCAEEARELNIGFVSRMERGRPWLRLKAAVSLDGRSALDNGRSQWITGEAARNDGHAWRKRAGAVLTGVGTVLDDDPRLDVRLVPTARQPLRVIVDSRLQTPPAARILAAPGSVLLYAAIDDAARRRELKRAAPRSRCCRRPAARSISPRCSPTSAARHQRAACRGRREAQCLAAERRPGRRAARLRRAAPARQRPRPGRVRAVRAARAEPRFRHRRRRRASAPTCALRLRR